MEQQNPEQQPTNANNFQYQQQINITQGKGNGLGTAGFVLALIALFLGWIPVLGWILWLLGVIFSLIGVFRTPRGLSIAGLIISFIGVIALLCIFGMASL